MTITNKVMTVMNINGQCGSSPQTSYNGIRKQRLELSKLLQDRYINVALVSEIHLKKH